MYNFYQSNQKLPINPYVYKQYKTYCPDYSKVWESLQKNPYQIFKPIPQGKPVNPHVLKENPYYYPNYTEIFKNG